MRIPSLSSLGLVLSLAPLIACSGSLDDGDDGAAHPGIVAKIEDMPSVAVDDELGTEVRVFVELVHYGGPDAETLEVVSASLKLDLEHYADIPLAIPLDHPQFPGVADGESYSFSLRGTIPDNHEDWGLCTDPQAEQADGQRVSLDLLLRVTPGANDEADEFEFESLAVTFNCTFTG
jgi:hypothetical protein